jgi:Ca2+-binding EF-hand superfamily protein
MATFFPPSGPQTMSRPAFLNTLSTKLAPFSSTSELLAAFSAFDNDDSGQIDVEELRDALINTAPELGELPLTPEEADEVLEAFKARRAFSKSKAGGVVKKGEVFKYQNFVNFIGGANGNADQASSEDSDDT